MMQQALSLFGMAGGVLGGLVLRTVAVGLAGIFSAWWGGFFLVFRLFCPSIVCSLSIEDEVSLSLAQSVRDVLRAAEDMEAMSTPSCNVEILSGACSDSRGGVWRLEVRRYQSLSSKKILLQCFKQVIAVLAGSWWHLAQWLRSRNPKWMNTIHFSGEWFFMALSVKKLSVKENGVRGGRGLIFRIYGPVKI